MQISFFISYLPFNLTLKDNPRLFARKRFKSIESKEFVYDLLISTSSLFTHELTLDEIKFNQTVTLKVNLVANNLTIEYNLLQGLLNQDFELFSSTDSEHIFIEEDLFLLWNKVSF